jgi:hypothetical protein
VLVFDVVIAIVDVIVDVDVFALPHPTRFLEDQAPPDSSRELVARSRTRYHPSAETPV